MLVKSLHEVSMIAVDGVHRKRPQHEARFGRRFDLGSRWRDSPVDASVGRM